MIEFPSLGEKQFTQPNQGNLANQFGPGIDRSQKLCFVSMAMILAVGNVREDFFAAEEAQPPRRRMNWERVLRWL
ncbi:MAG: hypothetical protein EOO71_01385 [Myxococcaceae bacterium]|nr:MAG: hypothetical protein EOO71_01385 [Myxococcaceae bacterium]